MKKLILIALPAIIWIVSLNAQKTDATDYTSLIKEYRELLKTEMSKNKVVGLSIALVDKNGIIWSEGLGYENLEDSVKATDRTIYGIGSITKLFTATALLQLYEKKVIDIDKPVVQYVPELHIKSLYGNINSITTRMLMTHSSGFPSDLFGSDSERDSYKNVVKDLNKEYVAFPPSYLRCYSNIGYGFLGYELEKLGKEDYPVIIRKNIFEPLGMKGTFLIEDPASIKNTSKTYDGNMKRKDEGYKPNMPAGGIFSNVRDMSLFISSWLSDKSPLLSTKTINLALTPQNAGKFNLGSEYGIGWDLKRSDYYYKAEHGGALVYYRSFISLNRYAGLGVIILTNSAAGGSITWRASELVDKACALKKVPYKRMGTFNADSIMDKKLILTQYAGNYGQNMSWYPLIARDSALIGKPGNDSLAFKLQPSGYFGLAVKQGDKWTDIPNQKFIFTKINGEKVFLAQAWGTWTVAAKQYPQQKISVDWIRRLGKYKVTNYNGSSMFSEAELAIGEKTLYITAMTQFSDQPMSMPFNIVNDTLASVLGTSTYSGSVLQVHNKNGKVTLHFMGLEMEKNK
jgi:CubicO group peptidase (beta-lactamase class C family)